MNQVRSRTVGSIIVPNLLHKFVILTIFLFPSLAHSLLERNLVSTDDDRYRVDPNTRNASNPPGIPLFTVRPTAHPTKKPSPRPSRKPTKKPTKKPSPIPTARPIIRPTRRPTKKPSPVPTARPTRHPSGQPSIRPTGEMYLLLFKI